MASTNSGYSFQADTAKNHGGFYAVYDSCVSNNVPSRDLAFIEQRYFSESAHKTEPDGEKFFNSLTEAKSYAGSHFQSGAEYFSINQLNDPDNVIFLIVDKITYLIS